MAEKSAEVSEFVPGRAFGPPAAGWAGYALAALGFALTLAAFYPGYMSPDSMANWLGGRQWLFKDVNGPVMTAVWGLMDGVVPGPAGMLVLQNLVFWAAPAVYWRATWRRSLVLGLCLASLAFMPQVWSQMSTIWKDTGQAATLFLGSALLYHSGRTRSKTSFFAAFPFLLYGDAVRLNSLAAVLPLALWAGHVACGVFGRLRERREAGFRALPLVAGAAVFLLLTGATAATNNALTGGRTVYPFHQVELYDLAAISKARGENLFPAHISRNKNFSLEKVFARYNIYSVNDLIWDDSPNPGDKAVLEFMYDPVEPGGEAGAKMSELRSKWLRAVWENKGAYLYHRWRIFAQLIGFTTKGVSNPYWVAAFDANPPEFRNRQNGLNRALMEYYRLLCRSPLFRGAFWMLVCFGLVCLSLKRGLRGDWLVVLAHAASGLLYAGSYFFTAPSTEFRYLLWTMIASGIALSFAVHLTLARRAERRAAAPA
ncbi:MAG TPA: hypothetical protein VF586_09585 [Pyrinomonadaceae bacterium]|jgi:hypothetical protein